MKVGLYPRVSTDEQAKEGFSIDAQIKKSSEFISSQGWELYDIYMDDGYSAKNLDRPGMQRMIKDIESNKFDVVVVYKLDRMVRSVSDLHKLLKLFERHNVKFRSVTEMFDTTSAMGRFFITLVAAMAEWERENLAERVRFGMEQMVYEGNRPGAKLPYGYTKAGELVPEEVAVIRELRSLYMRGFGCKSIAMMLNRDNNKLRRSKEWSDSTVAYTLDNPIYAGIIRFGSKNNDGKHVNYKRDEKVFCLYGKSKYPAIFTKEEYEEHMEKIRRKNNGGFSKIKEYWFSGVLRCGRCGSAMFGRLTSRRSRKSGETIRTQYYICSKKHDGRSCDMPTFRQAHVEHLLMQYIENESFNRELILSEQSKIENNNSEIEAEILILKKDLEKVKERKKKWQYMRVNDEITSEELKERTKEENEVETQLRERLSGLERNTNDTSHTFNELINLRAVWEEIDDIEKKQLIYEIFTKIEIATDLTKVKGVKNKFFDAYIKDIQFN